MSTVDERKQLIQEVLEAYPEKAQKRRKKHLNVYEEGKSDCGVKSNVKSVPGVMTTRGCAYAGAKGVVWGPVKDMVHISAMVRWVAAIILGRVVVTITLVHRRIDTFGTMQFTSDFQERDIVYSAVTKNWLN
jgi:nitrogenase molybdenum-iron protein alpha chain